MKPLTRHLAGTVLVTAFLLPGGAAAQIWKCTTAAGETIFQQTPCSSGQQEQAVDLPADLSEAQVAAARARQEAEWQAAADAAWTEALRNAARDAESPPPAPLATADAGSTRAPPPPDNGCPPGQVPLNASRADPTRGWSAYRGYVPLRCGTPRGSGATVRTRTGPGFTEPRRFQDQHGNWFMQPPGSTFATEEATGRQCFVYGNFVQCN